jgi:hypothetical protein
LPTAGAWEAHPQVGIWHLKAGTRFPNKMKVVGISHTKPLGGPTRAFPQVLLLPPVPGHQLNGLAKHV